MRTKKKILHRKFETGKLERVITLDRRNIDEKARTVPMAFSSEEPVERWWGTEILSHDAKHVRLGRMKDGAPLLVQHNPGDHVGTTEDVSIDKDRVGRSVMRFGRSIRADEMFQDVLDDIRKHVSVGYRIHVMEEDRDTNTFTAIDWEPYEVSLVSIPADHTVGVMREMRSDPEHFETKVITYEDRNMPRKYDKDGNEIDDDGNIISRAPAPAPAPAPAVVDKEATQRAIDAGMEKAKKDELTRVKEIRALGKEHNLNDMAEKAIEDDISVEQMRVNVLDTLKDSKPTPSPEIGLTDKEARGFSMLRALNALANPQDPRAIEAARFEIECSNAVAEKRGIDTAGFFVPERGDNGWVTDKRNKNTGRYTPGIAVPYDVTKRDLSAGTATDGAELVADNLLAGSFIDVLRNSSMVVAAGARMLTDLIGDVSIPRKTSGSVAAWIATEGGDAAQSDPQFDQVQLTPKTAGVYSEVTRQLLKQSSLDVEALLRTDLAAGMALLIDLASLYGAGASGVPQGIATATGVNTPTAFAAAVPTYPEVVAMESAVANDNALMGRLAYMLETSMRGSLKTSEKFSTTGQTIWEPGNTLNGYPTAVTNQVTSGDIFYGNWADLLIGAWGGLDLLIDPYTNSLSGTVRVVAHQSVDVAIRHPESFAFNNDTP